MRAASAESVRWYSHGRRFARAMRDRTAAVISWDSVTNIWTPSTATESLRGWALLTMAPVARTPREPLCSLQLRQYVCACPGVNFHFERR